MNHAKLLVLSLCLYIGVSLCSVVVTYAQKQSALQHSTNDSSQLLYKPVIYDPDQEIALSYIPPSNDSNQTLALAPSRIQTPTQSPSPEIAETLTEPDETRMIPDNNPQVLGAFTTIGPTLSQEPIDPNGSIIIPKINVNSPIVFDVSISDKQAYNTALENGVAHAIGTDKPSAAISNTYLFAHSTQFEEHIARYAAVFTKLNQLENGDLIVVYFLGKRYDYHVVQTEIVESFDVSVLTRTHDFPSITLQTCDPPGIPKNRLITTAKLIAVYDK